LVAVTSTLTSPIISATPTRLAVRDAEGALGEFVPKSRSRAGPADI